MMNTHDTLPLEIEEPFSIRIEKQSSNKKFIIRKWLQRIMILDDIPNQKHHRPIFIVVMSILHVFMYLLTYINISWRGQEFAFTLYDLLKFFVPCMRPTTPDIRTSIVRCHPSMKNETCRYNDVLKHMCFSFTYPHQIWRMVTVNLLHFSWLHLVSNLLAQVLQGIPLERKYGSVRVAVIYWCSGFGASLSFMVKNISMPAAGASGSLYGLMLFLIVDRLIAIRTNTDRRPFIIMQLAVLLLPHIIASIPLIIQYDVAHSAHIGGGLVGFLLGIFMLGCPWSWNNEHCNYPTTCRRSVLIVLILYYVITFTYFFTRDAPVVGSILHKL